MEIQISIKKTLILSLFFHAGLAVFFLSITLNRSTHRFSPHAYQVDLVTLPSAPAAPPAAVKDLPTEPSPPVQKPTARETAPPKEAARSKIEMKKPAAPPKPVKPAATVPPPAKSREAAPPKETAAPDPSATAAIPPMNTKVEAKVEGLDPNSSYYGNITRKIEIYWSPPFESTAEIKEAVVNFVLYPNGRIADPTIEKSSGNAFFDQAALRAVYEANPLPPFPQGIRDPSLKVHFSFLLKKKS